MMGIGTFKIVNGDVLEVSSRLKKERFDGCLCDPPYGLSFMGKKWDYDVPSVETWAAVLGALKPGAHLLAFAGTRTQHRMAVRIEDAGFEIRDMIAWVYGSGLPKSLDVSKAIDKAAGAEREIVGTRKKLDSYGEQAGNNVYGGGPNHDHVQSITAPATDAARQWSGYGTALKPALEPITVARKPLVGTVAANCQRYGTGAINIDECRVATEEDQRRPSAGGDNGLLGSSTFKIRERKVEEQIQHSGRWPANLILTYPEDEFMLRDDVTPDQLYKLAEWMNENSQR